jgi:toxin ParE1/3/4
MSEFRISERAATQFDDIYDYSEERFGRYQAEAYSAGLRRSFELLADFPRMGRTVDHAAPGLRRFRFQSHYIFYSIEAGHILVRGLIHVRQKLRPDLIE